MPTNPFFQHYSSLLEQSLIEDIIHESINIQGFDGHYVLMEDLNPDKLYGDNPTKYFEKSYSVALYLSNSSDPGLNQEFFSKFGLEIRNNTRVLISKREFNNLVPETLRIRPLEGDLIYIPWASGTGELYQINYVNDAKDNYMLGRPLPFYYELELEVFKYSHESINTGINDIDVVDNEQAYAINFYMANTNYSSSEYQLNEIVYQGSSLANSNTYATVADWNYPNKILKLINITGIFANNEHVIGATSNCNYILLTYDDIEKNQNNVPWDNRVIEDEIFPFIDTSESNPLGDL